MAFDGMISVICVSDYAGGEQGSWDDMRRTLASIAGQDYAGPVEVLLVEATEFASSIPAELGAELENFRVVTADDNSSYGLKNAGVEAAHGEVVAILDADCEPRRNWLKQIAAAFSRYPDAVAISGRTVYPGTSFLERITGLLTRSYIDPGRTGPARFVSNNNGIWRRDVYLEHPMPLGLGAFAARMQSEQVVRKGLPIYFDETIEVAHEFEGWGMEVDVRRNIGYGTVATRLRDPSLPHSWTTKFGVLGIPLIYAGKTLNTLGDCLRNWRRYGVRLFELPIAVAMVPLVQLHEVPGMWTAFTGGRIEKTEYR